MNKTGLPWPPLIQQHLPSERVVVRLFGASWTLSLLQCKGGELQADSPCIPAPGMVGRETRGPSTPSASVPSSVSGARQARGAGFSDCRGGTSRTEPVLGHRKPLLLQPWLWESPFSAACSSCWQPAVSPPPAHSPRTPEHVRSLRSDD